MSAGERWNKMINERIINIINAEVEFIDVCDSLKISNIED